MATDRARRPNSSISLFAASYGLGAPGGNKSLNAKAIPPAAIAWRALGRALARTTAIAARNSV